MSTVPEDVLVSTRAALHGLAELVMAGPQHRASGTIRLRVAPGAVETVAQPALRLTAESLSGPGGEVSLAGPTTPRAIGGAVGVVPGEPQGLYGDHAPVGLDDTVVVDHEAAIALLDWFAVGAAALLEFASEAKAVLWPEHFDLAITLDEVNYGISPGDGYSAQPYAYVGPWRPVADPFFDAPFGAVRHWDAVPDVASLVAFLAEGRRRAGRA